MIVGKHAETESLIKMHFKRKYFSEICSEQILTRVKIVFIRLFMLENCNYFHQADNL